MNWLIWRQHRRSFLLLVALLALYTVVAVPLGVHFAHAFHSDLACGRMGTCDPNGTLPTSALFGNVNPSQPSGGFNIVVLVVLAVPYLLGMFVGVPLISREYEMRTNLLVWTRGVSRRKWLTNKLSWTLLATIVFAGLFAALTTWWSNTGNAMYDNRFETVKFDLQGVAPVAFAVFAVSLGIALGAWLKRILPAIGTMFIVVIVLQIVVASWVRPHYASPEHFTMSLKDNNYQLSPPTLPSGGSSWFLAGQVVGPDGKTMSWQNPPKQCRTAQVQVDPRAFTTYSPADAINGVMDISGGAVDEKCLDAMGYHWVVDYQPADRYWRFQFIESGLYLLLSLVPLGLTYWLVLKRDA